MKRFINHLIVSTSLAIIACSPTLGQNIDALQAGFKNVPQSYRMKMFWRIFGPSLDKSEIDYQFKIMREAGLGGVMTFFTYPVALDDPATSIKNEQFLSPQMLQMFGYVASAAKREGLRFGVAGGTGWPYGGPTVTLEDSAQRIRRIELRRDGSGIRMPSLKEGEHFLSFYSDSRHNMLQ